MRINAQAKISAQDGKSTKHTIMKSLNLDKIGFKWIRITIRSANLMKVHCRIEVLKNCILYCILFVLELINAQSLISLHRCEFFLKINKCTCSFIRKSKVLTFQMSFLLCKSTAKSSYLPDMFWSLMRPFKWGTAWSFISSGIRIITSQSQRFQKRPTLLSKLG